MTTQEPYNQQTLNLQAAEFYKSIRKEKSKWESVIDLSPMLAEFRHYIVAGDYEKAFYVYDSIHNHLLDLSEFQRVIAMGETLLSEKDSFLKLSEVIVMKIKAYLSWSQVNIAQFDIGEKMALEAKVTAETLFEKGPSSTDYDSANEFKTRISNTLILMYMFTGQAERALDVQKEYVEKYQNEESILYKASSSFMQGWMFQTLDHPESTETMMRSLKYFNELDETKMDAYHLNEKARGALHRSVEFAKKGQTKASFDAYNESCRINRILNDDFFSIVMPVYASVGIRHSYDFHEARRIADKGVSCSEKHEHKYALAKNIHHSGNLIRDKGVWNTFINKSEPEEGEEKPYKYQKKAFTFFQAAIDYYQQAAEIAEKLGLKADESMLHGKIGNIYCRLGDGDPGLFVLAEENLKKALDLAQSDTTKYGTCLNLGRLYVYEAGKI
ncbi:MAG: hypothetical protein GY795_19370, partial [Desulfobacterales bacterium]|nr:hypothetical protein [Desulfobacterales bacterium]